MPNLEALRQLKRVVGAVPPSDFNLAVWRCGTVVCAMGAACLDSWFNERGLKFDLAYDLDEANPVYVADGVCSRSYEVGKTFFEITSHETWFIFSPYSYELDDSLVNFSSKKEILASMAHLTREMVIARIDQVIDAYTVQKDDHMRAWIEHRENERAATRDFSGLLQVEREHA